MRQRESGHGRFGVVQRLRFEKEAGASGIVAEPALAECAAGIEVANHLGLLRDDRCERHRSDNHGTVYDPERALARATATPGGAVLRGPGGTTSRRSGQDAAIGAGGGKQQSPSSAQLGMKAGSAAVSAPAGRVRDAVTGPRPGDTAELIAERAWIRAGATNAAQSRFSRVARWLAQLVVFFPCGKTRG